MVRQRLFLGSVAFGISFGITFFMGRDVAKAIAAGATTTVATVAASIVVDRQDYQQAHARIADLKNHIQALQTRRAEAYQAYAQLEAEKAQLANELNALPFQPRQPQLMGSSLPVALPSSRKALSWDLSAPATLEPTRAEPADSEAAIDVHPYDRPTEIPPSTQPPWGQRDEVTPQMLSEATAAKQKIEASLAALQTELSQIKGQISDHRQTREKLSRELTDLREQKRQLDATTKTLRVEVKELETCRVELEQFLADVEAKKHAWETGVNPLQEAIKQLQTQVTSLQEELRVLEAQIVDRRTQKALLEQQLGDLQTLLPGSHADSLPPERNGSHKNGSNGSHAETLEPVTAIAHQPTSLASSQVATASPAKLQASASPGVTTVLPEPIASVQYSADLPTEWTELMVQLPDYEFQVLKVIVEQNNAAAVLRHIAEENLTMPELLIDAINERALDTVGDILIDASAGAGAAAIVRDHLKMVKKLIKAYEYLVN